MNKAAAEGVKLCESACALAEKHNVDAPLIRGIYQVLHDGRDPREVMRELMKRKAKHESE